MPDFRRVWRPGGTYFFTLVTEGRATFLCDDLARATLREAIAATGRDRPFDQQAVVLLPDHWHALWRLPADDADYAARLGAIKARFTRSWLAAGGSERQPTDSRARRRGRGVWQRRYWEHTCRDAEDFKAHLDYIHWNPVKHGYVTCPHLWPWSSFRKWVALGVYREDWRCVCDGRTAEPIEFPGLDETAME